MKVPQKVFSAVSQLLPVLLFCLQGLEGAAFQAAEIRTFPVRDGDTLVIENDYGRIRVQPWDSEILEARIRRIAATEDQLSKVVVRAEKSGSRIEIQSTFNSYQSESVYLEVRTPSFLNVVIWGAGPAVELSGIQGYVRAYTRSGLVTATDLSSSVSLTTESGDVLYSSHIQPDRDIRLESIYGNIICRLVQDLNLRGWVRAGSELSWNREVEFSSGHLEKQVGVGGPLLFASSVHGRVSVDFNLDASSPDAVRQAEQESGRLPGPQTQLPPPRRSRTDEPDSGTDTPSSGPPPPVLTEEEMKPVFIPTTSGGSSGEASADGYSLKVDVNWIYLNVSVRDRLSNRSVPELSKEDFLVYEDRQLQNVEKFLPNEAPFNLLLLLDTSGSTREFMDLIQEASIEFTHQIKNNDRIGVATFNTRTRLIQPFTNDRPEVARSIRRIRANGGTAFYDALDRSIHDYLADVEGRKAVVVFTDGVDNKLDGTGQGSDIDFPELFRSIQETDTIIYTIFLDTEEGSPMQRTPPTGGGGSVIDILGDIIRGQTMGRRGPLGEAQTYEEARRQLQAIADQTGGRMYSPRQIYDLSNTYQEIADDLRVQYTLAYSSTNPSHDGTWREIDVRIRDRRDLAARTRRGYYALAP